LDRFKKTAEPGADFAYSDTGYSLLGEIIEAKTGGDFAAAYRKLLRFDALGMQSTWMEAFEPAPRLSAGFAHAYGDNGLDTRGIDATADTYGGGGLVSTVGRVVSAASLAAMQTEFKPGTGLGRGLFLFPFASGAPGCWGHPGFWGAVVMYCPADRRSVAVSLNLAIFDETNAANLALNPPSFAMALLEASAR
jgi:D-alanyl-D-alanine carboxypeptidase